MVVTVNNWNCFEDLTECVDSMLYDSGTVIASGEFVCDGMEYSIDLMVTGHVCIIFDGVKYKCPSKFPERVKEIIKQGKLFDSDEVEVVENNWFEYVVNVDGYSEGFIFEGDLAEYTPQELKEEMIEIVEDDNINSDSLTSEYFDDTVKTAEEKNRLKKAIDEYIATYNEEDRDIAGDGWEIG